MLNLDEDIIKKMREEIRLKIEQGVDEKKIAKGQRITIDKELLEKLLFETNDIYKQIVKLPVWFGDFLEYINLSEISFAGVLWDGEKLGGEIIYKNTNANINFEEASTIEYQDELHKENYTMRYCDFSGTDLSKNHMSKICGIAHCNLANTKFGNCFSDDDWLRFNSLLESRKIIWTSFQGLDFSSFVIDLSYAILINCNFADSKAEFNSKMDIKSKFLQSLEKDFRNELDADMFKNCLIDGNLVTGEQDQKDMIYRLLFPKKSIYHDTLTNIDEQILSFTKKDC